MLIGKPGPAVTSIRTASVRRIVAPGSDMCAGLSWRLTLSGHGQGQECEGR